jgi:ribose transport system substrate-binding protein
MQHFTQSRLGLLLLIAVIPLAGCGKPAARKASQETLNTKTVAVSLPSLEDPWRLQMKTDLENYAGKHPELRLVVVNAEDDAEQQYSQLRELHDGIVDVLIVSPKDPQRITDTVAEFFEAGTPVIVLDRALIGDRYTTFIAADPTQIGEEAGKWMADQLGGKGKLVELRGPADSLWAERLHNAWRSALRDPAYRIVFEGPVNRPATDPLRLIKEAFSYVQKIDAVFAYDDTVACAAYQAAGALRRQKGVIFVGVGGLPKVGVPYVSKGILTATLVNPTGGKEAIDAAAKLARGEKVLKRIVPPTRVITKDDIIEETKPTP